MVCIILLVKYNKDHLILSSYSYIVSIVQLYQQSFVYYPLSLNEGGKL